MTEIIINPVYDLAKQQWDDSDGSANLVEHFDTSDNKAEAEEMVAGLITAIDPHQTIVDLGCGPGRYVAPVMAIVPPVKHYKGYDTSAPLLTVARDLHRGHDGVRFINRDIFDGADYKRPVDVLLSIDTSRHYHDPLAILQTIMDTWPAAAYIFSVLHGPEDVELINGRCLASDLVDRSLPQLGRISAEIDQPITDGMVVRYVVIHHTS